MTTRKPLPSLALAAFAWAFQVPALYAQQAPLTPSSVEPSVYSGGAPAQRDGGTSANRSRGRSGADDRGNNPGRGDSGGSGRNGQDDSQSTYGMSVTTLERGGVNEPVDSMPLSFWLQSHLFAAYAGGGLGNVVAHFPASSASNVAGEVFAGARLRYAGVEASYDALGYYEATINNQPVQIGTDLFSVSLLGFLPLGGNADLYLRYGRTAWNVNAHSGSTALLPVMSGTDALTGLGIEFRFNELLVRVEAKRFRNVFQSDGYNYAGIGVGGYFY